MSGLRRKLKRKSGTKPEVYRKDNQPNMLYMMEGLGLVSGQLMEEIDKSFEEYFKELEERR